MTEHEKRAEKIVASYGEMYDAGYTAGFEAGLRARMPSDKQILWEIQKVAESENSEQGKGFQKGVNWLAATMRNEGV